MKKTIFLSVPMKGRENKYIMYTINKMKSVIKAMFPEDELTFIDNLVCNIEVGNDLVENNLVHGELLYLGEAIKKMAFCDCFVNVEFYDIIFPGCDAEERVARNYDLKCISLRDYNGEIYLPDVYEKIMDERKKHNNNICCDCKDGGR